MSSHCSGGKSQDERESKRLAAARLSRDSRESTRASGISGRVLELLLSRGTGLAQVDGRQV
jgi:hypothetical protein